MQHTYTRACRGFHGRVYTRYNVERQLLLGVQFLGHAAPLGVSVRQFLALSLISLIEPGQTLPVTILAGLSQSFF